MDAGMMGVTVAGVSVASVSFDACTDAGTSVLHFTPSRDGQLID